MRVTIDFDDELYGRLKEESARRGRAVRELVDKGVRHVLDSTEAARPPRRVDEQGEWRPSWYGALAKYGRTIEDHSMAAVGGGIVRGRKRERRA